MRLRLTASTLLLGTLAAVPGLAQTSAPASTTPAVRRAALPVDSLVVARKYALWFATSQADSIFAHLPAEARERVGSAHAILDQFGQVTSQIGSEASLVEERWVMRGGQRQYWRVGRYTEMTDEPFVLRIVIMPDGGLGGIGLSPLSQLPQVDPEP